MMETALGAPSRYCSVVLCLSAVGFCGDGWESLGSPLPGAEEVRSQHHVQVDSLCWPD
jgi:hypothetical protein